MYSSPFDISPHRESSHCVVVAVALSSSCLRRVPCCGCHIHNRVVVNHSPGTGTWDCEVSMASVADQLVIPAPLTPPHTGRHIGSAGHLARWRLPLLRSTADIQVSGQCLCHCVGSVQCVCHCAGSVQCVCHCLGSVQCVCLCVGSVQCVCHCGVVFSVCATVWVVFSVCATVWVVFSVCATVG